MGGILTPISNGFMRLDDLSVCYTGGSMRNGEEKEK